MHCAASAPAEPTTYGKARSTLGGGTLAQRLAVEMVEQSRCHHLALNASSCRLRSWVEKQIRVFSPEEPDALIGWMDIEDDSAFTESLVPSNAVNT